MLPEDQLQLLTAAVDGELAPRESHRLRLLLAESSEARTLFARLQADQRRLRSLATVTADVPTDLRDRVMAALPAAVPVSTPTPVPTPIPATRPRPVTTSASVPMRRTRGPVWVPLAVAAALLLAVAASSFWFFLNQDRPDGGYADRDQKTDPTRQQWNDILPPEQGPLPSTPAPANPHADRVVRNDTPPVPPDVPGPPEVIPPPRIIDRPVYGYPTVPPLPPLDLINVRIPFLVSVADLDREDVRQRLTDELGRDPAYRIDLFVKDTARGVELLQKVAAANGLTLFADAGGLDRVRKRQVTSVVVYTDSLTPAEARDLLGKAAAEDAGAKGSQRVLDVLHVTPLLPPDHRDHQKEFHRDLRDLFGADPGLWKKPALPAAGAAGDPKPLSAGTGDEVVKSLTTKPGEKTAILLPYGPPQLRTPPAMSTELRQYLSRRAERRSNGVPIVIVIRPASG